MFLLKQYYIDPISNRHIGTKSSEREALSFIETNICSQTLAIFNLITFPVSYPYLLK